MEERGVGKRWREWDDVGFHGDLVGGDGEVGGWHMV